MENKTKGKKTKTVNIRNRFAVCFFLYLSAVFGLSFFGLSFLQSYELASEVVEQTYYSVIELALGVSGLTLNYLLLSTLIVGVIGGLLTLTVAIICSVFKKYSPIAVMIMAFAIAALTYAFVMSLLFPAVISASLSELPNPMSLVRTLWPIIVMSGLLGSAMIIDYGLLIYASIDAYASSGIKHILQK